jgi:hypothetical protein
MSTDTPFRVGQRVVATGDYNRLLTKGHVYTVVGCIAPVVLPDFTFPPYVTVIGDHGRQVTGHTYRFSSEP